MAIQFIMPIISGVEQLFGLQSAATVGAVNAQQPGLVAAERYGVFSQSAQQAQAVETQAALQNQSASAISAATADPAGQALAVGATNAAASFNQQGTSTSSWVVLGVIIAGATLLYHMLTRGGR